MGLRRGIIALAVVLICGLTSPALAASGPVNPPGTGVQPTVQPTWHFLLDFLSYATKPNPPGMNDWKCRTTKTHPRPVILVHGTFVSQSSSWGSFSPALKNAGYCVYGLTYSTLDLPGLPFRVGGMTGIPKGSGQLAAFVKRVRRATGARKVDLIGHSQGGTVIAHYLKFRGGARRTANAISLAGPVYPPQSDAQLRLISDLSLAFTTFQMGLLADASGDPDPRSVFTRLNRGGVAVRGPSYTTITTRYDEIAFPREISVIPGGKRGTRVKNILLQDVCPNDYADHISLAADPNALALIRNILTPKSATPIKCRRVIPFFGVDDDDPGQSLPRS
jgi:triacylglycerol lipase